MNKSYEQKTIQSIFVEKVLKIMKSIDFSGLVLKILQ